MTRLWRACEAYGYGLEDPGGGGWADGTGAGHSDSDGKGESTSTWPAMVWGDTGWGLGTPDFLGEGCDNGDLGWSDGRGFSNASAPVAAERLTAAGVWVHTTMGGGMFRGDSLRFRTEEDGQIGRTLLALEDA